MVVTCYNIKYAEKASEISVIGPDALANFMEPKYREFYGKGYTDIKSTETMPKEIDIEVHLPEPWLENLTGSERLINAALEAKTGFKVESFDFRVH